MLSHPCPGLYKLTRTHKIKTVGVHETQGWGRKLLGAKRRSDVRPYNARVVRDHGGGLWTFEDDRGQMYLAVLSRENHAHRRDMLRRVNVRLVDSSSSEFQYSVPREGA